MVMLASISLLAPLMLGGMVLVGLPIAAHLLNRKARRAVVFPSIRLLREASASQSRFFRLRRWWLLALRALAVALLVLAFAEPAWRSASADTIGSAGGTTVFVLDASASTRRADAATTTFERMRGEVGRMIERLDAGASQADVIVAGAHPRALAGRATSNLDALRVLLQETTATEERADMAAALALAGQILADQPRPTHIVVVTDGQTSNWLDEHGSGLNGFSLADDCAVDAVVIASPDANVGLEAAGIAPQMVLPGQPCAVRVRARAFAGASTAAVLRIELNGREQSVRSIEIPGEEGAETAIMLTIPNEGFTHSISITHARDALSLDDRVFFSVNVGESIPVVLIADDDPDDPASGTFYLARALAPFGDARDRFVPRVVASSALNLATLGAARVVFVGDVTRISESAVAALKGHLASGGGIVWFCGGGALSENLAALERSMPDLLPFVPGAARQPVAGRPGTRIVPGASGTAMLTSFDASTFVALGQAWMGRVRDCSRIRSDALQVLAYDDGTPGLSVRRYGDGTFALANFSPAPRNGDLGRHAAFVALAQNLAAGVVPEGEGVAALHPGATVAIAVRGDMGAAGDFTVIGADGRKRLDASIIRDRNSAVVTVPNVEHVGIYRVERTSRPGVTVASAAVNMDPRESDTRSLSSETLGALLRASSAGGAAKQSSTAMRPNDGDGAPLWWVAILVAMVAMVGEFALLLRWNADR